MIPPPIPANETLRLQTLLALGILDTECEERFDLITSLAKRYFDTKMVRISFIDKDRIWFKSKIGLKANQTSRSSSFCGHVVEVQEIFEVPDTLLDPRFADNPVVTGGPKIRYYAGLPIRFNGFVVGALCLNHNQPKLLTPKDRDMLVDLGGLVENELHRIEKSKYLQLEAKHKLLLETIPLGIRELDLELKITYSNQACADMYEYPLDEFVGMSIIDLAVDPEKVAIIKRDMAKYLAMEIQPQTLTMKNKTKSGRIIYVMLDWDYKRDIHGRITGFVGATTDITSRIQKSNDLKQAIQAAEQANLAKSQFLASMSHELRTPLNAILGFAQILELNADEMASSQLRMVQKIYNSGEHLLGIINDILDLAGIEAGNLDLQMEPLPLAPLISGILSMMEIEAETRHINLHFNRDGLETAFALADSTRFKQVMLNIISNGIKYNVRGGEVRVHGRSSNDGFIEICISDTGPGIPKEKREQLFEPFNRLGAEATTTPGTGIGLSISKKLIEAMGGAISCCTQEGPGSCFMVKIPETSEDQDQIADTQAVNTVSQQTCAVDILYIEDNQINVFVVQEALAANQHITLTHAKDGKSGIQMAREQKPGLILLDISLPDMDGFAIFKQLRKIPETNQIPIIAISAHAGDKDVAFAMRMGFAGYIKKPFIIKDLVATIKQHAQQIAG